MRLIDADALMPNAEYKGRYDVVTAYDIANAPTIEPDREAIENEVWELARRIICPSDCCEDSISAHTKEIFNKAGWETRGIFNDLSYQEAKAKYEEWKKEKEDEATMKEVTALAEKIGIHKLYSMVKEIRGE